MKKGNRTIPILVALLVLYLGVGLLFMPRGGNVQAEPATEEKTPTEDDLLSYAVGVIIARDIPYVMNKLEMSDAEKDFFVNGICDAFPSDDSPRAVAYANGVIEGAFAMEELEKIEYIIAQSDSTKKIDRSRLVEGIKAMATNDGLEMSYQQALEYYNVALFREPSEEFIENIQTRGGVEVLECGIPVKIESKGDGETPALADTIGYIYKASFINGNTFDSSQGMVVEAKVATLPQGLIDVVTALPVGTRCKVYLPWQKAYGESGYDKVPPYTAIVYDLEIVKIVK